MSYQQPYGYPGPPQLQVVVQPYRCSSAHVVIAWTVAVLTGLYMLPWAVAATRNRRNVGSVALVDALLGWSLVGWVVALVMACGSDRPVVVVQTYAPPALPPQQPWGQAVPQQPWGQPTPQQQWVRAPQPWAPTTPAPALPPGPGRPYPPAEPTRVDPLGSEPTQQLPRSPWEPDHRR